MRNNKARLAFEMLEKEMEVIPKADLIKYAGGYGSDLGNGYCVFMTMCYLVDKYGFLPPGYNPSASYYYNNFINEKGNEVNVYSSTGNVLIGVRHSAQDMIDEYDKYHITLTPMKGGTAIRHLRNGGEIITSIKSSGPNNEVVSHSVVINGVTADGLRYNYYDPTTGRTGSFLINPPDPNDVQYDVNYMLGVENIFSSTGSVSSGFYGSSGLISTGFDNDGTYWENYYVYDENGPYASGDTSWGYASLNYSTGYNYSTGSSTGGSTGSTGGSTGY